MAGNVSCRPVLYCVLRQNCFLSPLRTYSVCCVCLLWSVQTVKRTFHRICPIFHAERTPKTENGLSENKTNACALDSTGQTNHKTTRRAQKNYTCRPQNEAESKESEATQKVREKVEPKEKNDLSRTVCFVDWQLHVCRCAVVEWCRHNWFCALLELQPIPLYLSKRQTEKSKEFNTIPLRSQWHKLPKYMT